MGEDPFADRLDAAECAFDVDEHRGERTECFHLLDRRIRHRRHTRSQPWTTDMQTPDQPDKPVYRNLVEPGAISLAPAPMSITRVSVVA
ncbi:hypothetical protein [Microbacterium sp.]|uniref:hypothetical protein n=1 Tax=Microbacterium sp. TaxID=51671 RepID=UPI002FE367F2